MNRTLLFTVLLATAGIAQAHDHAGGDERGRSIDKVNGGITAQAGEAYGDLSTVNGGIDLERGAKAEDVETVNGGIEAEDDVSARSVSTVNGGIRFGQRARIDGGVETVNGGIFIDRGGNVRSDISTVNGAIGLVDTDLGGGIETGKFVGATDKRGEDSIERICGPGDFLATIYHHLGIDWANTMIRDFNGRPTRIVENGKPIPELMA